MARKRTAPPNTQVELRRTQEVTSHYLATISKGVKNPSVGEVCSHSEEARRRLSPALVVFHLPQVRQKLERDYGMPCCLVNDLYYVPREEFGGQSYREMPPDNISDAIKCLPNRHHPRFGIHLANQQDDWIITAAWSFGLAAARRNAEIYQERIQHAVTAGWMQQIAPPPEPAAA